MRHDVRRMWLAVAGVALALFALVAADVVFGGALTDLDRAVGAWFVTDEGNARTDLFRGPLSLPGDKLVLVPAILLGAIYVGWRDRVGRAGLMVSSAFAGLGLSRALKYAFDRGRPNETRVAGIDVDGPLDMVMNPSFPSGHTFGTTVVAGVLVWFMGSAWLRNRAAGDAPVERLWPFAWAWCGLSLGMGAVRVIGGVHWVSDVVASWAVGVAWLALTFAADAHMEARARVTRVA